MFNKNFWNNHSNAMQTLSIRLTQTATAIIAHLSSHPVSAADQENIICLSFAVRMIFSAETARTTTPT
jgi:hypothetical protein